MQPAHLFTKAPGTFGWGSLGGSCKGRGGGDRRRWGRWDGMGWDPHCQWLCSSQKCLLWDLTFSYLNVLLFCNHNRIHYIDNNTVKMKQ